MTHALLILNAYNKTDTHVIFGHATSFGGICYIAFDMLYRSLTRYIPLVTRSVIPRHATTLYGHALFLPDTPQLFRDMLCCSSTRHNSLGICLFPFWNVNIWSADAIRILRMHIEHIGYACCSILMLFSDYSMVKNPTYWLWICFPVTHINTTKPKTALMLPTSKYLLPAGHFHIGKKLLIC